MFSQNNNPVEISRRNQEKRLSFEQFLRQGDVTRYIDSLTLLAAHDDWLASLSLAGYYMTEEKYRVALLLVCNVLKLEEYILPYADDDEVKMFEHAQNLYFTINHREDDDDEREFNGCPYGYYINETVFAYWEDTGYFYPATTERINGSTVEILYLDGTPETTKFYNIRSFMYTAGNMWLWANRENKNEYYAAVLVPSRDPSKVLAVRYEDGIIEDIDLIQLAASDEN